MKSTQTLRIALLLTACGAPLLASCGYIKLLRPNTLTRLPQLNLGFADFSPTWFCNALIF